MTKDRAVLTAYLDRWARWLAAGGAAAFVGDLNELDAELRMQDALSRACVDAGWTIEEIDTAFLERFGGDPRVQAHVEQRRHMRAARNRD